jgi:4-hydroxybenzoate polyprenyltransferase
MAPEPWYIGAIFGLFLLGASTTKDFADMEGDARGGCRTLPIIYGVRRAAWMISPSFVVPFLMIGIGARAGILTGNPVLLYSLSGVMTAYGAYVCYLMLRRPDELALEENHVPGHTCTACSSSRRSALRLPTWPDTAGTLTRGE